MSQPNGDVSFEKYSIHGFVLDGVRSVLMGICHWLLTGPLFFSKSNIN